MHIDRITCGRTYRQVFKRLMPQLIGKEEHPSLEELEKVVESENTFLFFATEGEEVIRTTIGVLPYRRRAESMD